MDNAQAHNLIQKASNDISTLEESEIKIRGIETKIMSKKQIM